MGSSSPRICAGRSMLRPYEDNAMARRIGGIVPRICAGRSGATPLRRHCGAAADGRHGAKHLRRA